MPHIDFNYSGLGEAYRVFSQKWARLLSVRDDLEHRLANNVRRVEEDLEVQRTQVNVRSGSQGYSAAGAIDMLDMYDQHREWQSRVLRSVREMELAYLVAMADAFVGRWRQEHDLPAGADPGDRWWFAATEKQINETLAKLHTERSDVPLRVIRGDTAARLKAIRNQRDALMHRDSEGVDDITEDEVDAAILTLNSVCRALAFVTRTPLPHDSDGRERERFIAEALEVVETTTPVR